MVHEQNDAACSGQRFKVSKSGQYDFEMGIVRARTVPFNVKIVSFACKGAQTSHLRTWANFGQILCYTCEVVGMPHEQHDAACSG